MSRPSRTPFAAVIGDPVLHSLSPSIFAAFSEALGRPLRYEAVRVPAERLAETLREAAALPWAGCNVTLPHKVAVLGHLDELDATARAAGAANVIRFAAGRRIGYNTDAEGFLAPLLRAGFVLRGVRAVVLGSGGAARAVCAALAGAGTEVRVLARSPERAAGLAGGCSVIALASREAAGALAEADLVVNATSAGMDGSSCALPEGAELRSGALAYDLVYRPARTPFLERARAGGARTMGGLGMLVAQAAATWRIWFGTEVPGAVSSRVESELAGIGEN